MVKVSFKKHAEITDLELTACFVGSVREVLSELIDVVLRYRVSLRQGSQEYNEIVTRSS